MQCTLSAVIKCVWGKCAHKSVCVCVCKVWCIEKCVAGVCVGVNVCICVFVCVWGWMYVFAYSYVSVCVCLEDFPYLTHFGLKELRRKQIDALNTEWLDIQASCKIATLSKILKLTIRAIRYGRPDGPTMIVEKLCFA